MRCPRKSVVTANAQGEKMMHSCYVLAVRWDAEDVFVGEGNSLKQLPKISTFSCAFFGPGIAKVENCFWRTCWPFRSADSFVQVQLSRVMESSEMLGTCEKRERECRQLFGCGYHGGSSLQIWNFFKRWSFSKSSLAQRHSTYITGGRSHLRILISVSWMTHIRCGNCAFFFLRYGVPHPSLKLL